jgi:hypothetical protein
VIIMDSGGELPPRPHPSARLDSLILLDSLIGAVCMISTVRMIGADRMIGGRGSG